MWPFHTQQKIHKYFLFLDFYAVMCICITWSVSACTLHNDNSLWELLTSLFLVLWFVTACSSPITKDPFRAMKLTAKPEQFLKVYDYIFSWTHNLITHNTGCIRNKLLSVLGTGYWLFQIQVTGRSRYIFMPVLGTGYWLIQVQDPGWFR